VKRRLLAQSPVFNQEYGTGRLLKPAEKIACKKQQKGHQQRLEKVLTTGMATCA
jgi:hypothetical protein